MIKIKKEAGMHTDKAEAQGRNKAASREKGEFNSEEIFLVLF